MPNGFSSMTNTQSITVSDITITGGAVNNFILTTNGMGQAHWAANTGGDSGIAALSAELDAEIAARIVQDNAISGYLATEITNRQNQDTILSTGISTHTTQISQINSTITNNETEVLTNFVNLHSGSDFCMMNHLDCTSIEISQPAANIHIYAGSTTIDGTLGADVVTANDITSATINATASLLTNVINPSSGSNLSIGGRHNNNDYRYW